MTPKDFHSNSLLSALITKDRFLGVNENNSSNPPLTTVLLWFDKNIFTKLA